MDRARSAASHKSGGALGDLIGLLADLPEGISAISKAAKLGAEIADQLRAAIDTNPVLKSAGANLDPITLFAFARLEPHLQR